MFIFQKPGPLFKILAQFHFYFYFFWPCTFGHDAAGGGFGRRRREKVGSKKWEGEGINRNLQNVNIILLVVNSTVVFLSKQVILAALTITPTYILWWSVAVNHFRRLLPG